MASKVDVFVERSEAELASIRQDLEIVSRKAQSLANRWAALGKTTMAGWAEYGWASKPYTAAELAIALNGLSANFPADSANLTNINTSVPVDRIVKASL
jgi:hypothetical protein